MEVTVLNSTVSMVPTTMCSQEEKARKRREKKSNQGIESQNQELVPKGESQGRFNRIGNQGKPIKDGLGTFTK